MPALDLDNINALRNALANSDGELTTPDGYKVLGYTEIDPVTGNIVTTAQPEEIIVPPGILRAPQATSMFRTLSNLDVNAAVGDTFNTPVQIYDSVGASHVITVTYTRTSAAMQPFTWNAAEARDARVTATVGGVEASLSFSGTWAVFRLFQAADNWAVEGFTQRGQWTLQGGGQQIRLPFELNLGGAPPIFQRGYFSGASCAGDIAR